VTTVNADVSVRQFRPGDEALFRILNEEWIKRHFSVESKDLTSLTDPQREILSRGGKILFAARNEDIVGCCALVAMCPGEFEVAKMAVSESSQGAGIGRCLLEHAIALARDLKATRLYLETNQILVPAIRLYESVGFRHVPAERVTPSPYARANVFMEMFLK
jgi:putative acetyltransferase